MSFSVSEPRAPRDPNFPEINQYNPDTGKYERVTKVFDVLDNDGKAIVTYVTASRAQGVVNYLNKMLEFGVDY